MSAANNWMEEVARIRRVSDQICTGHAILRDRYARKALALDLIVLASSTWIVALAFVSPKFAARLTPFHWNSGLWLGTLSALTFFASLVQLKTDWKSRSDAHKRTLDLYAEVKREAGYFLASETGDEATYRKSPLAI